MGVFLYQMDTLHRLQFIIFRDKSMIQAALRVFAIDTIYRASAGTHRTIAAFFAIIGFVIFMMLTLLNHIHKV